MTIVINNSLASPSFTISHGPEVVLKFIALIYHQKRSTVDGVSFAYGPKDELGKGISSVAVRMPRTVSNPTKLMKQSTNKINIALINPQCIPQYTSRDPLL